MTRDEFKSLKPGDVFEYRLYAKWTVTNSYIYGKGLKARCDLWPDALPLLWPLCTAKHCEMIRRAGE